MKADAHRRHAESLERAIVLARPDPTTFVAIIENAWGAAYHWMSYGCVQKYQQHRDKQDFTAIRQARAKSRKHSISWSAFVYGQRPRREAFMKVGSIPAWLDEATAALVEETVNLLIKRHVDILLAVILFGSVTRHEERPPDDASPSDVDLIPISSCLSPSSIQVLPVAAPSASAKLLVCR